MAPVVRNTNNIHPTPPISYQRSAASIILQCHCLYIQQITIDPFIEHKWTLCVLDSEQLWTKYQGGEQCHLTGDMKKVRISAFFANMQKD